MKLAQLFFPILFLAASYLAGCAPTYVHVGPQWKAIQELAPPENSFRVKARGDKSARLGEEMSFSVTSEKPGRLWVVQVDPRDRRTVVFPNSNQRNNAIRAGERFYLPPKNGDWLIEATEPAGESILAFVVTTGDAELSDVLALESLGTGKSLRIARRPSGWSVDKLIVNIQPR